MKEQRFERFKDAIWFKKKGTYVIIGGAGGIGSWLTLFLTRCGFNTIVYDFDNVEAHNIGGQFYSREEIDMSKVVGLNRQIFKYCNTEINSYNKKYTEKSLADSFMFSCFDNMEARKVMFDNWKSKVKDSETEPLFIDGRLSLDNFQIFCVFPSTIEKYESYLFKDEEVEDEPCTLKQTTYMASMIASQMTSFFTNHMSNLCLGEKAKKIPFKHEYISCFNFNNVEYED